jgi:hypothetical protein
MNPGVVKNYYGGSWIDISDYIVDIDGIPYTSHNRDFSIRIDSVNIKVAASILDIRGDIFEFQPYDDFEFYDGLTFIFSGYVKHSKYNTQTYTFDIQIDSDLGRLGFINSVIQYANLHALFTTGTNTIDQYRPMSFYNGATVGLLWGIKQMFTAAGLALDTSVIDNVVAFHANTQAGWPGFFNKDYLWKQLFFGENELYCISQGSTAFRTILDDPLKKYNGSKIFYFDFISEICSQLGLALRATAKNSYKIILGGTETIASSNFFEYSKDNILAQLTLGQLGVSLIPINPANCLSGADEGEQNYDAINIGFGYDPWKTGDPSGPGAQSVTGASSISVLGNFQIRFEDTTSDYSFDPTRAHKIVDVTLTGGFLYITTLTPHGFTILTPHGFGPPVSEYVIFLGVPGMPQLTRQMNVYLTAVMDDYTIKIAFDDPELFLKVLGEGVDPYGWLYRDTTDPVSSPHDFYHLKYTNQPLNALISTDTYDVNGILNILKYKVIEKISNYTNYEILTNAIEDDTAVAENKIDLKWSNSQIIQETY